ncbi:MAG: hypothetical protein M1834_001163 [Cirrosporium novae-zelandiae]|nr:MAG: hypothetical protein M1834_001163 [Cirrosporium novae-zelandiae]
MRFATLLALSTFLVFANCKQWYDLWYDLGLYGAYPWQTYDSVDLVSPQLNVLQWDDRCDDRYTLLTPRGISVPAPGPMIIDAKGNLVWMEKRFGEAMDLKIQNYKGEDYLTFWAGKDDGTHGRGYYYMLNSSYEIAYKISPVGEGLEGDLHEFQLTENGTALMTIYEIIQVDLSAFGRKEPGWVYDGLFQEIDIETGKLLFQWRSSDYYPVEETYNDIEKTGYKEDKAFDYFHINSIDKDTKGNYYVSSRYMHTVTCISPSGDVLWVLGGRHNDFEDLSHGAATNFSWQHHVNWHPNNTITIFDNGSTNKDKTAEFSRGLAVSLDLEKMTATLLSAYVNPKKILAASQGSVQILPDNGNVFVGWGHSAAYTEFTAEGEVLCDVHFGSSAFFDWGWIKSYRAFKGSWVGHPKTSPDIRMWATKNTVFVSWNGATEVVSWKLEGSMTPVPNFSEDSKNFGAIQWMPREGFEAKFELDEDVQDYYLRVAALNSEGEVMGYTKVVDRRSGHIADEPYLPREHSDFVPLHLLMGVCFLTTASFIAWEFRRPLLIKWERFYHRYHRIDNSNLENIA